MKIKLYILVSFIILLLIGVCVFWSINIYHQNYSLWLNEYNAQIQQFGFYKDDIILLDQQKELIKVILQIAFNALSYMLIITISIIIVIWINDNY
jgi:hypothetical protein